MATFSSSDIAFIREQIRILVDPLIMKLRTELYGGNIYGTISETRLPDSAIKSLDDVIEEIEMDGSVTTAYTTFTAGTGGVQSGKLLAYDGTRVVHADITDPSHAGQIVGIAREATSENYEVKVQQYGVYENENFNFSQTGPLMPGTNGDLVFTLDTGAVFSQFIGIALGSSKMFIALSPDVVII